MAEEERAERRAKLLAKVPDRPGKRTSRPPRLYSQTQAEEIEAKQTRILAAAAAQRQAQVAQAAATRRHAATLHFCRARARHTQ